MTLRDVAYFAQQADGYCLPACAQMALAHLGISISQEDLARRMGVRRNLGVPYSRITRLMSSGVHIEYAAHGDLDTLCRFLDRDLPVILFIQAGELPHWSGRKAQHAILVVEIGEQEALILDPYPEAQPAPLCVPLGDLVLAWDEMSNAYAVISLSS